MLPAWRFLLLHPTPRTLLDIADFGDEVERETSVSDSTSSCYSAMPFTQADFTLSQRRIGEGSMSHLPPSP
jgi:hypothetical protein